jgi:hypothetical protein
VMSGMRMVVRLTALMFMPIHTHIARNPFWVGMSARFTGLVTVCFGGAGVRHGGFLARFVV